jgi:hypothetical protein
MEGTKRSKTCSSRALKPVPSYICKDDSQIKNLIFASIEDDKILDCFQSMMSHKKQLPSVASGKLLTLQNNLHIIYSSILISNYFFVFASISSSPMIDEKMVG